MTQKRGKQERERSGGNFTKKNPYLNIFNNSAKVNSFFLFCSRISGSEVWESETGDNVYESSEKGIKKYNSTFVVS